MEEVKCPFCGAEAERFYFGRTKYIEGPVFVGCEECISEKEYWEVERRDLD